MPSFISSRASGERPRSTAALIMLWIGVLIGPIGALLVLEADYVLSYVACATQREWYMHAVAGVAVLAVAGGGIAAWRARERDAWMAQGAALLCAFFIIVILAFDMPVLAFRPCQ